MKEVFVDVVSLNSMAFKGYFKDNVYGRLSDAISISGLHLSSLEDDAKGIDNGAFVDEGLTDSTENYRYVSNFSFNGRGNGI